MIRYILGYVLMLEAALLALCSLVGLIFHEPVGWIYLAVATGALIVGILLNLRKPRSTVFYLKEGCVATALSWIVMSLVGCLPFVISGEIPKFTDALFETVSGLTTTGASILSEVESLSHVANFWRSLTHLIGGMGVLVFLLAVLPLSGAYNINLMRAESPGPSVGKLVPKIKFTAQILYTLYLGMTFLEFILLMCGGMNWYESICTAFATAGTGGFGIYNDSLGRFTPYCQWVVTAFMMFFGFNFNFYYFLVLRKWRKAVEMEEVRVYLITILAAILIIFIDIRHVNGFAESLRQSAFQVASLVSSTGFSTADFDQWASTSKCVIVLLMFVGACAGSTGGGFKVSRIIILIKSAGREMFSHLHPRVIRQVNFEGKPVDKDLLHSVHVYLVVFMLIFITSVVFVSFEGTDFATTFTSVLATINNIGPGLSQVGPTCNYGHFHALTKYVLMFDMLAGRLELFPMLMLFYPAIWKDVFEKRSIDRKVRQRRLTTGQ